MHQTMRRLYEAAEKMKGMTGQSEVARALNSSPQTLNNWEARGMSKPGMLKAQAVIGCSATWLEGGVGPMSASAPRQSDSGLQWVSPEESELLTLYRGTDDRGRATILQTAKAMPVVQ